jgi:hypothetical protein
MPRLRYVTYNGQLIPWREIVALYREQAAAAVRPEQPLLFDDLKTDFRPPGERTAAERYNEPSLFSHKL